MRTPVRPARTLWVVLALAVPACTSTPSTTAGRGTQAAAAEVSTIDGFDWSVPADTTISGRLTGIDIDNDPAFVSGYFLSEGLTWAEINPQPGVYDFSVVDDTLARLGDRSLSLRLEVVSWCDTPGWARAELRHLSAGTLVFWDDAYLDALGPLLTAFGERYRADDRVVGVYLPIADGEYHPDGDCTGDRDGWGEMWMEPDVLAEAETDFGLTPERFETASIAIVDRWVDAFAPHQSKLAYMNLDHLFVADSDAGAAYNEAMGPIGAHALTAGTGARDGEIESWMRYIDEAYGVGLEDTGDQTCRLTFDEAYAQMMHDRYTATENEFYGTNYWVPPAVGPVTNQPYRFLVSSLRALQMRRNDMQVGEWAFGRAPFATEAMFEWLPKVLGRTPADTPDVFALLGERYVRTGQIDARLADRCSDGSITTVRNIERWLTETGTSEPVRRVDLPASEAYWGQSFWLDLDDHPFEYSARASTTFEFDLDDDVAANRCAPTCNLAVLVTYDASGAGASQLAAVVGDSARATAAVEPDSGVRTVSFGLDDVSFAERPGRGPDLIVHADPTLAVMLVRVVFEP